MQWPHDDLASKNAFYGNFQAKNWGNEYLVRIHPSFIMRYEGKVMSSGVLVNKKIVVALMAVFAEVWEKCQHDQKKVDATGISDYGGCYNPRPIAGSSNWSNHSWAAAIDLSPGTNGFRHDSSTTISNIVIDAFRRQGALWGGDYHGRKDPMHFEFVSR